jgi:NTE family protein
VLDDLRRRLRALAGLVPSRPTPSPDVALVLSGGGARASYQAGVIDYMAGAFPEAHFSIVTGVSAGAINAALLANHRGSLEAAAQQLVAHWEAISTEDVYEPESSMRLLWAFLRGGGDGENGEPAAQTPRGLVDTAPLRRFLEKRLGAPGGRLEGIAENLASGYLKATALITTNYATGQSVSFVQGRDFDDWERPNRISRRTHLTIDHVMASASLPLMFPAIEIEEGWYGDGGVRQSAPLAPAIHLGADRLMVISTRYDRSRAEADDPSVEGYPPPAQVIGTLMNAVFLDTLDQDTLTLRRVNKLIDELPRRKRHGMRPVDLLTLRPSENLGKLAGEYEADLPTPLRMLTRGLGADQTQSPDWLSMLLFEHDYVARLIDIGYRDAERQHDRIAAFMEGVTAPPQRERVAVE